MTEVRPAKAESAEGRVTRLAIKYGDDVTKITEEFFRELHIPESAIPVLMPWIRDRVLHTLRDEAMAEWNRQKAQLRVSQGRANAEGSTTTHAKAGSNPDIKSELAFMDCRIIMSGAPQGFKLYRNLTAAEHKARGLMHSRSASSALHSARSHEWSATMITKHGVKSLNDIPEDVLFKELPREGIRP